MRRSLLVPLALTLASILGSGGAASAWRPWVQQGPDDVPPDSAWDAPPGDDDRGQADRMRVEVDWRALEEAVLDEMNLFRRDPRGYVAKLEALRRSMRGNLIIREGDVPIATREGVAAVDEAIEVLSRAPRRLPRFAPSHGLADAARSHATDLGRTGALGHEGSDGSSPDQRVSRFGRWQDMVAENIAFGPTTAEEVVVGLIVDDGVADRGHRDILLEGRLFFAGVACGPHPSYGATCVIDYASGFETGKVRAPRNPRNNWRANIGPR